MNTRRTNHEMSDEVNDEVVKMTLNQKGADRYNAYWRAKYKERDPNGPKWKPVKAGCIMEMRVEAINRIFGDKVKLIRKLIAHGASYSKGGKLLGRDEALLSILNA